MTIRRRPQYERHFTKWGFSKYESAEIWDYICPEVRRRKAQNKDSEVWVNGRKKTAAQLNRAMSRNPAKPAYQSSHIRECTLWSTPFGMMVDAV